MGIVVEWMALVWKVKGGEEISVGRTQSQMGE